MDQFALLAQLRARPGKEAAVEEFLVSARDLVLREIGTTAWYAVRFDSSLYGIFDTFPNQEGREARDPDARYSCLETIRLLKGARSPCAPKLP